MTTPTSSNSNITMVKIEQDTNNVATLLWIQNIILEIRNDLISSNSSSSSNDSTGYHSNDTTINPTLRERIYNDIYVKNVIAPKDIMKYMISQIIVVTHNSNNSNDNRNLGNESEQQQSEEQSTIATLDPYEAMKILDIFLSFDQQYQQQHISEDSQEQNDTNHTSVSFAITASYTIQQVLQNIKKTLDSTHCDHSSLSPTLSISIPNEFLNIILHQACTATNPQIVQHCYHSIILLCTCMLYNSANHHNSGNTITSNNRVDVIVQVIGSTSNPNCDSTTTGTASNNTTTPTTAQTLYGILQSIISIWDPSVSIMTMNGTTSSTTTVQKQQQLKEHSMICVRCTELILNILLHICTSVGNNNNDLHELLLHSSNGNKNILCNVFTLIMNCIDPSSSINDLLFQITMYDVVHKFVSSLSLTTTTTILDEFLFTTSKYDGNAIVIQPLLSLVGVSNTDSDENDDIDPYIKNAAIRILIAICHRYAVIVKHEHSQPMILHVNDLNNQLMHDLYTVLRNYNIRECTEAERLLYIDAISSLVSISSPSILDEMLFQSNNVKLCHQWMNFTQISQPKMKSAILNSIANVIDPPILEDEGGVAGTTSTTTTMLSDEICMKIYNMIGKMNNNTSTTDLIVQFIQSSIVEIRYSAYRLLHAISKTKFGCQVIVTNTIIYNILLQRNTDDGTYVEQLYDGRQLKYNIIVSLYNNPFLLHDILLNDTMKLEIQQYIQQGPHYKKVYQWDVITAEQ